MPEGIEAWTVPAAAWAFFTRSSQPPAAVQKLQKRVVYEWLPDSGYEWAQAPDIEVYLDPTDVEATPFQV